MHMRDLIAELEVAETIDIGGGDAGAEAAAPEAATADGADGADAAHSLEETPAETAAPAWTPEQIAALRDMPEFHDLLNEEAGRIADSRLEARIQQMQQQPTGEGDFDPNEFLNPMSEDFGQNLYTLLNAFAQQAQAPFQKQQEQAMLAEGQQRMVDIIDDDFSRNGPIELGEGAPDPKQVIQQISPLFLEESVARYGDTPRAGEAALAKATSLIRSIVSAAEKRGASQNANRLATLSNANGEPGTGGAAIHNGDPAASVEEALKRAFARGTA